MLMAGISAACPRHVALNKLALLFQEKRRSKIFNFEIGAGYEFVVVRHDGRRFVNVCSVHFCVFVFTDYYDMMS